MSDTLTKTGPTGFPAPNWRRTQAVQRLFDTVPQDEIVTALVESGDERAVRLAERLGDERLDRTKFARHCYAAGLRPVDAWNILVDSRKLEARVALSAKLPDIVGAVAEAAVPAIVKCRKCKGTGQIVAKGDDPPADCPKCDGYGEMLKPADKDSQKMALEMGDLLNQKVPLIAQQFNTYGRGGGADLGAPDMTEWSRSTDSIFEEHTTTRKAEEAELVD